MVEAWDVNRRETGETELYTGNETLLLSFTGYVRVRLSVEY